VAGFFKSDDDKGPGAQASTGIGKGDGDPDVISDGADGQSTTLSSDAQSSEVISGGQTSDATPGGTSQASTGASSHEQEGKSSGTASGSARRWTDGIDPADDEPTDPLARKVWKLRVRLLEAEAEVDAVRAKLKPAEREHLLRQDEMRAKESRAIVDSLGIDRDAANQLSEMMTARGAKSLAELLGMLK